MKLPVARQSFDGQDLLSFEPFDGELTGSDGFPVDEHRAGSAKSFTAAKLGACQSQVSPQHPEKHALAIDADADGFAVELKRNGFFHAYLPGAEALAGIICK